jgi:hypothetical protein
MLASRHCSRQLGTHQFQALPLAAIRNSIITNIAAAASWLEKTPGEQLPKDSEPITVTNRQYAAQHSSPPPMKLVKKLRLFLPFEKPWTQGMSRLVPSARLSVWASSRPSSVEEGQRVNARLTIACTHLLSRIASAHLTHRKGGNSTARSKTQVTL